MKDEQLNKNNGVLSLDMLQTQTSNVEMHNKICFLQHILKQFVYLLKGPSIIDVDAVMVT